MRKSIASGVLKHLGLVGNTTIASNSLVPRGNTPSAQQQLMRDFGDAGRIEDPDVWARYGSLMQNPQSFEAMLKSWEEMAGWDLMAAALQEFVDEVCSTDSNSPGVLWYECNDQKFEDEINDLLVDLDTETILPSQVWHVAATGNHFEKIDYSPGLGVTGLRFVHPIDVRRFWLERNRQCIGFRWQGHIPNKDDAFVGLDNVTPLERVTVNDGENVENLWYPWDFLHFRRMFRNRATEHGEPVFSEAQGIYRKLRLAIDQMVVHRAQVQPDRYAVNIDVQEQPPTEQMKTVQRWKQSLRSKLSFGPGQGTNNLNAPTDFKSFYNPMSLDTVLWIARPKGFAHGIEKIPGTANIPDVYDIELLTDLFYSILGMPKSWFGMTKDGQPAPSGKALLAQDIRFLRKVKGIRRPILNSYTWLAYFHAVLTGRNVETLDIKAKMSEIGGLEEQMKIELLEKQAAVLAQLGDVMEAYNLPKEAWVEIIFKRYMHLPDEVVNVFITSLPNEIRAEENLNRRPAPRLSKILREVEDRIGRETPVIRELRAAVYGNTPTERRPMKRFRTAVDVLSMPDMKNEDIVVGTNATPFKIHSSGTAHSAQPLQDSLQESDNSGQAWRKYI